jgi:serine/threonine protein kinase
MPELALRGLDLGADVVVDGRSFRLPWETRPDRVDGTFTEQWSPEGDAVRGHSYAYAETGSARHAWVRRVAFRDGSDVGARWRRGLTDEATLLARVLPQLPGLPEVLAMGVEDSRAPLFEVTVVTSLLSAVSLRDRSGRSGPPAEETVRAIIAGLPPLCAALGALHDAGLAHGALDAAAILADPSGDLALRDLGRATETALAPATGELPTKSDDVLALARIVYASVTGVPPLTGSDGPPVPACACNPAVPEHAATALSKALTGGIRDARNLARQLRPAPRPRSGPRKPAKITLRGGQW